jgi:drug/metabolite transporter (DMT)-like permease
VIVMMVSALLAAALYGTGAAVEQRQAAAAPEASAGHPRLLVLLARQPLWLLGLAAQVTGFAAHAVALRSGPLAVVQMLVGAELIVAVLLVRCWSRRRLSPASWAAAFTVVAGIAAFLVLTSPSLLGHGAAPARLHDGGPVVLAAVLAGVAAAAFAAVGLRAAGRRRAVLLAVAAGLGDCCAAVVTMAFAHLASHSPAAMATSWATYALIVSGAGNVLLTQTAYQTGRPMVTLPVISAVTPVTSVAIGIGLLGESPGTGLAGGLGAALAVVVTGAALAFLARSAGQLEPQRSPELQPSPMPRRPPATQRPAEVQPQPGLPPWPRRPPGHYRPPAASRPPAVSRPPGPELVPACRGADSGRPAA